MIFVVTFAVLLAFMLLMSLGYIFQGKRIKGSCGGLGKVMGEDCDFCEKKDQCKRKKAQEAV